MFFMLFLFTLLQAQRMFSERIVNGERIRWPFTERGARDS